MLHRAQLEMITEIEPGTVNARMGIPLKLDTALEVFFIAIKHFTQGTNLIMHNQSCHILVPNS